MDISIVIPTLNEENNLKVLLPELPKSCETIIVDGYSEDKTADIAKKFGCRLLYDSGGKGSALIKGMNQAKGDIIIMMDADCSHVTSELPLLIAGIKAGYDVCMGSRFIQGGGTDDMPFYRRWGNKFFVHIVNFIWKTNYSDLCYGYRSLKKEAVKKLNLKSVSFAIETEMSIKAAKSGLKILEVPSFEKHRLYGKGKLRTFKHGWEVLKTIIKEALER